jgi:glycosyltransferase involved in cell wall biosynthesis
VDHAGVVALLQRADVFCFPTVSSEGFPKAVLEAMACGLPVVTTRVSVLPELLASGGGVLLDEATPAALADAIRRCLADDARYAEMSSAGRGAARGFSLERWRDTIGEHLRAGWGPLRAHA